MNVTMALKAEVMLAVQIITRHRAPRLVLLLAGILMLAMLGGGAATSPGPVLLVAGSLGAVAGSRLLARGGALAGARRAAGSSLVPAVGRLAGALLLMGPVLLAVTAGQTFLVALVLGATTTAMTMALSPAVGASAAAALGFVASWLGAGVDGGDAWVLLGWLLAALWASAWVIERFPEDGGTRDSS